MDTLLHMLVGYTDLVTLKASSTNGELLPVLQVSNHWVAEGNTNILWLPPIYRDSCLTIWNGSLAMGHPSGRISFFHFKKGPKIIM